MSSRTVSSDSGLRREIGLFQLVAYGVGNIVGTGIYVLVGEASGLAGGMVWLSFLGAAIIALFTGLSYAELGAMYPRAASEYVFLGRAYGSRLLSFMTQWTMLLTEVVAASAVALGFAGYMNSLTGLPRIPVAIGLLVVLALLVLSGIRDSIRVNTVLSLVAIPALPRGKRENRRSPPASSPVVDPRVDRNGNAAEGHGDEHPPQRVEIRHQR
jgi:APA family basic amino acid/polyamine antiporter